MRTAVTIRGRIIFCRETPADLHAVISKCSARFPNVIIEESKRDNGRARGTNVTET